MQAGLLALRLGPSVKTRRPLPLSEQGRETYRVKQHNQCRSPEARRVGDLKRLEQHFRDAIGRSALNRHRRDIDEIEGKAFRFSPLTIDRQGLFVERLRTIQVSLRLIKHRQAVEYVGKPALVSELASQGERLLVIVARRSRVLHENDVSQQRERRPDSLLVAYLPGNREALLHMLLCLSIASHEILEHSRGSERPAAGDAAFAGAWARERFQRQPMPQATEATVRPGIPQRENEP